MSNLQQILTRLDETQLKQVHEDIMNVSLAISAGGKYKHFLDKRRAESKGRLKNVYAALCTAKPREIQAMADRVVAVGKIQRLARAA